jgi:hypothetical protein
MRRAAVLVRPAHCEGGFAAFVIAASGRSAMYCAWYFASQKYALSERHRETVCDVVPAVATTRMSLTRWPLIAMLLLASTTRAAPTARPLAACHTTILTRFTHVASRTGTFNAYYDFATDTIMSISWQRERFAFAK